MHTYSHKLIVYSQWLRALIYGREHYLKIQAACKMRPCKWYAVGLSSDAYYRFNLGLVYQQSSSMYPLNRNEINVHFYMGAMIYIRLDGRHFYINIIMIGNVHHHPDFR